MSSRPRAALHPHEAIAILVGLVLMLRQAWLLDDAFVYFRYADNLLFLGRGLVYNQGEWVEGYSSPLWMLLCVVLRATHLDWWWIVRGIGVVGWLGFALMLCRCDRAWRHGSEPAFNLPLLHLCACYPVLCYFTSGLESPLVQLAAGNIALAVLEPERRRWRLGAGLWILVRHELALAWLVVFAYQCARTRRLPWTMLISTACLVGAWLLARVWMYAELLPNTFYLKHANMPQQGWRYLRQLLQAQALLPWMLAAAVALWFGRRRGWIEDAEWATRGVLLAIAALGGAYVIRIGGDMMYYRMLAVPFLLAWIALGGIAGPWIARLPNARVATASVGAVVVLLALLPKPPQLDRNPHLGIANRDRERPVVIDGINDANSHRKHPDLAFSPWAKGAVLEQRALYALYRTEHPDGAHEKIVVEGWCVQSYRDFDTRVVQRWGLTDPYLARLQLPWDRPGHKFNLIAHAELLASLRREAQKDGKSQRLSEMDENGLRTPAWVQQNLDAVRLIDAKIYNSHELGENLRLATRFAGSYPARR